MLDIRITLTGDPLSAWEQMFKGIGRAFPDDNRPFLRALARRLETETKESFERGYRIPSKPWPETHPFWQERLQGRTGTGKWTGRGQQSIKARIVGQNIEIRGEDYLERFHSGGSHKETFSIIKTGDGKADFIKVPGRGGETRTRWINVKARHLFDATDADVEAAMREVGDAAGLEWTA